MVAWLWTGRCSQSVVRQLPLLAPSHKKVGGSTYCQLVGVVPKRANVILAICDALSTSLATPAAAAGLFTSDGSCSNELAAETGLSTFLPPSSAMVGSVAPVRPRTASTLLDRPYTFESVWAL
jgi:hypothetical protein